MKPNSVGSKLLYLNPVDVTLSTAEIALIDTAVSPAVGNYSPYAYTATLRDDYDTIRVINSSTSALLATGQRLSVGVFLSAQNNKDNLLFQVSGMIRIIGISAAILEASNAGFFFGRKATNNTIVSSKAAVSNTLEKVMNLCPTVINKSPMVWDTSVPEQASAPIINVGIQSEIFTLAEADKFAYCFGAEIGCGATTGLGMIFDICLSIRKYNAALANFEPERP